MVFPIVTGTVSSLQETLFHHLNRNKGFKLDWRQRTWGDEAGEGKMLFCTQLLASLTGSSVMVACWITQQVDLRTA